MSFAVGRQYPEAHPCEGAPRITCGHCGVPAHAWGDIGAAEYIHRRIIDKRNVLTDAEYIQQKLLEHRQACTAILMISEDLDEVFGLSDRIAVMYEGRIMGIVELDQTTREAVGLMMAGVSAEAS